MRFRLSPIVTLDELERRKRPPCQSKQKFRRPPEKFRLMFSTAKCRSGGIVSKNIRYVQICIAYYRAMLRKAQL